MAQEYREHFRRNGHAAVISVFDNFSPANQHRYGPPVEAPVSHIDDAGTRLSVCGGLWTYALKERRRESLEAAAEPCRGKLQDER